MYFRYCPTLRIVLTLYTKDNNAIKKKFRLPSAPVSSAWMVSQRGYGMRLPFFEIGCRAGQLWESGGYCFERLCAREFHCRTLRQTSQLVLYKLPVTYFTGNLPVPVTYITYQKYKAESLNLTASKQCACHYFVLASHSKHYRQLLEAKLHLFASRMNVI